MLIDVPRPSPSPEFLAAQDAAFVAAEMANIEFLANNPNALRRDTIAPHFRKAAIELLEGNPVTPERIDALSHLGTSDAPPGV